MPVLQEQKPVSYFTPGFPPCALWAIFASMFTKIDWINFEHHVLYDGLTRQSKVSYRDVANNIAPDDLVTAFESDIIKL